jgi:hypothetical protein
VRAFLKKKLPEGRQAQLIAYLYGTYEGATQPEAIAFEVLTYFVNGYDGAMVYLFPGGYDARYWQALADANRLIAQFEDHVFAGQAASRHRLRPKTPLPAPDETALPDGEALPLLLSWEFERGDERLIAVGNFWEDSDCFFDLAVAGLAAGKSYVLREPASGRIFADRRGRLGRSASDLERGTLLHVGAMRFAFFIVEPFRERTDYGRTVLPREMHAALRGPK